MRYALSALAAASLIGLGVKLYLRWKRDQPDPALEIHPPTYSYHGHDEGLAIRSKRRREAASAMRTRAANLESGTPLPVVLKMAGKR